MKSLLRSFGLLALIAPLFTSSQALAAEPDPRPDAAGTYTLRIRTAAPEKSPWGELLLNVTDRIKRDVAELNKKNPSKPVALNVDIRWQTKSEAAAVRSCVDGKSSGIAVSLGALSASVPELDATELPYLFDNYAQADKALTAALPLLTEIMATKGFIFAIRGENGFRQWASKTSFLTKPGDFSGRAMRSQPSTVHKAMYSALGATPNPLQISDVPTSLTNGVVDGYDNTLLFARLANWTESIKYVTMSNHIYQGAAVVWCNAWFKDLPPELKTILTKRDAEVATTEQTGLKLVRVFNDKLMPAQYKKANKEVKELSSGERAALKAALASVETGFEKSTSEQGRKLLKLLKSNR